MPKKITQNFFNNNQSAIYYYTKNKFYDNFIYQKEYFPYQIDTWNDKKNYGLTYNNKAIYPTGKVIRSITNTNGSTNRVLIFVADAFEELKKYNSQFVYGDKKVNNNSIYVNLNVKSAMKELNDEYVEYCNNLYVVFKNIFSDQFTKQQINSFDIFLKYFVNFTRIVASGDVFLRSSFLLSKRCDLAVSGLAINIDQQQFTADADTKEQKYFSDPNFESFTENAKRFGFYVDKNSPWRIIADLESPVMKNYSRNYGINNIDELFSKYYTVAYYEDLLSTKHIAIAFWNKYISENPVYQTSKQLPDCKNVFIQNMSLNPMTEEIFDIEYSLNWQLRLQLLLKVLESRISLTQNTFETIFEEVKKINSFVSLNASLDFINDKVSELVLLRKQKNLDLTEVDNLDKIIRKFQSGNSGDTIIF